jgi:hypothetical protein
LTRRSSSASCPSHRLPATGSLTSRLAPWLVRFESLMTQVRRALLQPSDICCITLNTRDHAAARRALQLTGLDAVVTESQALADDVAANQDTAAQLAKCPMVDRDTGACSLVGNTLPLNRLVEWVEHEAARWRSRWPTAGGERSRPTCTQPRPTRTRSWVAGPSTAILQVTHSHIGPLRA